MAKKRAEPYTKIVEEFPEMRRDTLVLVKKAVEGKRKAPLTIRALRTALQGADILMEWTHP
ncbi:MAG: hypothetical protein JSS38_14730, partial [Nitrospira sp.]|nr:hypothetical protein [Nitrospira sp.]